LSPAATAARPVAPRSERIRWVPKQFGAWAILAVPLLLGVAASEPSPWHLVLAAAAVCAYLGSVAALEWARSRRTALLKPMAVFGAGVAVSGLALLTVAPALAWIAAFVLAAAGVTLVASLAGRPKSVIVSLVEVAQALALVPAAALVSGADVPEARLVDATLAAGLYLVGSVLMVRSLIRERGNRWFLGLSLAYHAGAVGAAWWLLPMPYAGLAIALLARAVVLPVVQDRWRSGRTSQTRLRPIHIGLVEIAVSLTLVALAFAVGF
jgi:hypothetical protein